MESPHPATVNTQKGMTSRRMWALPDLPHTQCLLSRKAGTDMSMVALRLDGTGSQSSSTRKKSRKTWVPMTPIPDVAA